MFLDVTSRRNPQLIDTAVTFHQAGIIPANCYLIDQDAVSRNASLIKEAADRNGIALYFITKQIGFNPLVAQAVLRAGIKKAVAVDPFEVYALARNGVPIGHVGHLVQIPRHTIKTILALKPEVITTYSIANAEWISKEVERQNGGEQVSLLLRVDDQRSFIYPGQARGIDVRTLTSVAGAIEELPHVCVVGVTAFPCLLFDEASHSLKPTPNFVALLRAAELLQSVSGIAVEQLNAPSNTCAGSMQLLAAHGATHGEPGHALTGTTPLHAYTEQPELPAMVYVSEVSHCHGNRAIVIGGGIYRRATVERALVGCGPGSLINVPVLPLDVAAIDYYVALDVPQGASVRAGDTVIWASRTQAFVTRAYVAVAADIQSGRPRLLGIFDPWGNEVTALCESLLDHLPQDGTHR